MLIHFNRGIVELIEWWWLPRFEPYNLAASWPFANSPPQASFLLYLSSWWWIPRFKPTTSQSHDLLQIGYCKPLLYKASIRIICPLGGGYLDSNLRPRMNECKLATTSLVRSPPFITFKVVKWSNGFVAFHRGPGLRIAWPGRSTACTWKMIDQSNWSMSFRQHFHN